MPTISIQRQSTFRGKWVKFKVLINNQLAGTLENAEIGEFEVGAGSHKLKLYSHLWIQSPEIVFMIQENESLAFETGPLQFSLNSPGMNIILLIVVINFFQLFLIENQLVRISLFAFCIGVLIYICFRYRNEPSLYLRQIIKIHPEAETRNPQAL